MKITVNREKNIRFLYTFLIVTFPIVRVYASGITTSFNLAEMILALFLVYYSICFGLKNILSVTRYEIAILIAFFFDIGISIVDGLLVSEFTMSGVTLRICKWGFYYAVLLYQIKLFDLEKGIKLFKYTGLFVCILMWIQIISYRVYGVMLTMKIPFLKINAWQQEYLQFDYNGVNIYRPYSVFQEPAHIVYYISLVLCLVLFIEKNSKHRYIWAIIFSVSLAASTSTTAFIFLGVIWGWFGLGLVKSKKVFNYYLVLIFGICMLLGIAILINTSYAEYVFDKLLNGTSRTKSFIKYFAMLPGRLKLTGIGVGNEAHYFIQALNVELGFVNGFGYLLLSTGLLGCIVYVLQLMGYFIKNKFNVNILVILYVLLLSIDIIFRDIYFVLYMSIPIIVYRQNKQNEV